jgi:hypothetical protein
MISIPIFIGIIYITQIINTRKKENTYKQVDKMQINNADMLLVTKGAINQIKMMIENIKNDMHIWRQETSQTMDTIDPYERYKIEDDINTFYEQKSTRQKVVWNPNDTLSQEELLHREQIRIMNNNISKFLFIYREKQRIIDEKNRSIHLLQQRLNEIENTYKEMINTKENEQENDINKRFYDIGKKIENTQEKSTFIIIFMVILIVSMFGLAYVYINYMEYIITNIK